MTRHTHAAAILLCCALALTACSSKRGLVKLDAEDSFARGKQYFERRKYVDAMEDFREVVYNYAATRLAGEASYYLAECYLLTKDYSAAIDEYTHLLGDYPNSSYAAQAQYKIALSYFKQSPQYALDQKETSEKARSSIITFFERFPDSPIRGEVDKLLGQVDEKLAHKEFEAGRIYFKMKDYKSAKLYFDYILKEYPGTPWADKAREYLSKIAGLIVSPPAAAKPQMPADSLGNAPAMPDSAR
jgi:outer membrane protein assembly factor BamD